MEHHRGEPRRGLLLSNNLKGNEKLLLNYTLLEAFLSIGLQLALAKVATEIVLFLFSYVIQEKVVFAN